MTLDRMAPLEPVIGVIGTGYLGATHAACLAELGFDVLGSDHRPERGGQARGRRGAVLRARPRRAARRHTSSGRLGSPTTSPRSPSSATCTSSAWAPRRAGDGMAADLQPGRRGGRGPGAPPERAALVVGKSTVPVGTDGGTRRRGHLDAPRRRPTSTCVEPGVPARGPRGRRHAAARPDRARGLERAGAEKVFREVYAACAPRRRRGHRLRHGRAGQGGRQRVPGDEDLLHQRRWPSYARRPAPT